MTTMSRFVGGDAYAPLTDETIRPFLATLPAANAKLGGVPANWTVREVGDGNLNLVFIVKGPAGGRLRQAGAALCAAGWRELAVAA